MPTTAETVTPKAGEWIEYDPLFDTPPWKPAVKDADRLALDMCTITYLGGIARINAEEGRGAETDEIRELAKKAGYRNAREVNGWNSNPRSHGQVENIEGQRFLNDAGHDMLRRCAKHARITIIGDVEPLPISQPE